MQGLHGEQAMRHTWYTQHAWRSRHAGASKAWPSRTYWPCNTHLLIASVGVMGLHVGRCWPPATIAGILLLRRRSLGTGGPLGSPDIQLDLLHMALLQQCWCRAAVPLRQKQCMRCYEVILWMRHVCVSFEVAWPRAEEGLPRHG